MSEKAIKHNGKWYRTVERRARNGEEIIIVSNKMIHGLVVGNVYRYNNESAGGYYVEEVDGRDIDYRVLEPLESEETPNIHDLLANLARRVASLEQQLSATQSNVEKLAEELENANHRIRKHATMFGMLTDDIITLDERSQVLNAINKFYEEGSR
jgi:predicted RNase H-like nuclease (RuvC/YqgF family)